MGCEIFLLVTPRLRLRLRLGLLICRPLRGLVEFKSAGSRLANEERGQVPLPDLRGTWSTLTHPGVETTLQPTGLARLDTGAKIAYNLKSDTNTYNRHHA